MGDYYRRAYQQGWLPVVDSVNAPKDALLRGDNLLLDEVGILGLRRGSAKLNGSPFADVSIDSLHTFFRASTRYRMSGAGSSLYVNGVSQFSGFTGSGDIALHSDLGYGFAARGSIRKKTNGTTVTNWGPTPPLVAPTVEAITAPFKILATCDGADAEFTAQAGVITATYPPGEDETANGSIEITPSGSGRVEITKAFAVDTDLGHLLGTKDIPEDEQDVFSLSAWVQKPDEIDFFTVMVGVSDDTNNPFLDHYFFDFRYGPTRTNTVNLKETTTTMVKVVRVIGADDSRGAAKKGPPELQVKSAAAKIARAKAAKKTEKQIVYVERKDTAVNDYIWGQYNTTRAQFNRVGAANGRNWKTVRAIKIVYKTITPGQGGKVRFDNLKMFSSYASLTGLYRFHYRYVKDYDVFQEVSAPSPSSPDIYLLGQQLIATIPSSELAQMDTQTDQVWWYIEGGFLDRPYRCFVSKGVTPGAGVHGSMPWYAIGPWGFSPLPSTVNPLTSNDLKRLVTFGFGYPQFTNNNLIVTLQMNEVDILIENETGDADLRPPENIIDIAGPYFGRLVALVKDPTTGQGFLHFSRRSRPGSFFPYHALAIGDLSDIPYWVQQTIGGLYVGTSRDIFVVIGNGDESEDGTIDLAITRINIQSPPVSEAVCSEANAIIYRAADGWRSFNGAESMLVPNAAVELLYRNYTRHGISPVTSTGRSRAVLWAGTLTAFVDETGTQAVHRYNYNKQQWYRHIYPQAFRSMHRELDGTILAGDGAGFVWQLDTGTLDGAAKIPVTIWTPVDDDGKPYNRKDAADAMLRLDTGADSATVNLHLDGGGSAMNYTAGSNGMGVYKKDLTGLAAFRQVQQRITGSFSTFKLYDSGLAYRTRPRHRVLTDTGYVRTGREDLVACKEIRVCTNAAANLTMKVFCDDVLLDTIVIVVTPGVTTVYPVGMKRGIKGQTFRVTLAATGAAGTGEIGQETYWVEFRFDPTGNLTDKNVLRVAPDEVLSI